MNPQFNDIYNELRYAYRNSFLLGRFELIHSWPPEQILGLESAIYDFEEKLNRRLRPDARLFLVSNFHLMVLMPTTHPLAPKNSAENIQEAVRSDIYAIMSRAADQSKDEPEISGGAILRAVSELWKELKSNTRNIWT